MSQYRVERIVQGIQHSTCVVLWEEKVDICKAEPM